STMTIRSFSACIPATLGLHPEEAADCIIGTKKGRLNADLYLCCGSGFVDLILESVLGLPFYLLGFTFALLHFALGTRARLVTRLFGLTDDFVHLAFHFICSAAHDLNLFYGYRVIDRTKR